MKRLSDICASEENSSFGVARMVDAGAYGAFWLVIRDRWFGSDALAMYMHFTSCTLEQRHSVEL